MPYILRGWRRTAAVLAFCFLPAFASAQQVSPSLKLPTIVASVSAGADWASTYHALKFYELRETNPLLQPFQRSPGKLVAIGAALDAASFSAWTLGIGERHPRLTAAGLWGMAAFRTYLVIHNLRNERKAARRER